MKLKILFAIISVCISTLSLSAIWVDVSDNSSKKDFEYSAKDLTAIDVHFSLQGYEYETIIRDGIEYKKITIPNEGKFIQTGLPDLPRITRLIAIPNVGGITLEVLEQQEQIESNFKIYPAQKLQIESQPIDNSFSIDESFYAGSRTFPESLVQLGEPAIMRDLRIVTLTINPFSYDSKSNELHVITDLILAIRADENLPTINPKTNSKGLSRAFEPIYKGSILNYNVVASNTDNIYQEPCYLFIYPNNTAVLNTLENLSNWKKLKGYEVHLASTTETGTSTTSIKNYIQNAYDNWTNPPEFIAFIGDANGSYNIPTYYEYISGYGGEGDHPYSQLDGGDILADVITGRLSFNTTNEFNTIVSKILNYEMSPYMGSTNWYNKALMVGDPSTSGPSCVSTKQAIKENIDFHAPNITSTEVYSGNFDSAMSNGINGGVAYFNYRGYYQMSSFNNTDINNLTNGKQLPFAVFLTCDTGSFASETCRSETFIRVGTQTSPQGAIAAIGTATTGTHTAFNNCVDAGIFYGIFTDKIYNPGGAVVRGKLHLYNSFPGNPSNKVTIFSHWNTLMGDPGVELWTGVPQDLIVEYDDLNLGENSLQVVVTESNGNPVEGAWVSALSSNEQIIEKGYTDEAGVVLLSIDTSATQTVNLTVTKHDFIPHLGSFDIIESEQFVNSTAIIIDDDNNGTSIGNNDSFVNPGETIELVVELENFGTSIVNNVTATINSDTDFITITDNTEDFGNIPAGSTASSSDNFDFSVNSNVLGGSEIQLDMQIQDDSGNSWSDYLFIPVQAANLYVSDYSIEDSNGLLEPGETVDMVVTLFNTGSIAASGLEAELSCSNEYIEITDSLATFTEITSGQSGNNDLDRFNLTADTHIINGSQVNFVLSIFNSNGFDQTVTFLVDVGNVTITDPLGPDEYGYYAYDSNDDSYDMAPDYDWIEIDPDYSGPGTVLNLYDNGDEGDVTDVDIPFTFNFYGVSYDMISVCSNGWIAPGGSTQGSFMNSQVPAPQGPSPMIAAFWDDLRISNGNVCYYYDSSMHYFIVEWSHLKADWNSNSEETFQIIIYDPAYYPTTSGDAEYLFQYETINNVSTGGYGGGYVEHGQYSTVGLEDHTGTVGLEYTYNNDYSTAAATLQNGLAIKFTTNGGGAQSPPVINLNQTNFNFVVLPGSSSSQTLEITNNGESNLIYNISKSYPLFNNNTRTNGGPDNFGHQWFDSNEENGPTYSWRDISGLGTEVTFTHNDEGTNLIPIGFDFNYYGTDYSNFRINPNGWVGFGDDNTEWSNSELPDSNAPKPAIMPFWDDLDPISNGSVEYYSTSDSLIVWFNDVEHFSGTYNGTYDFQLILFQTGDILIQYRDVSGDLDSSTIGMQNGSADDALMIVHNSNYVEDELAIYITKVIDWVTLDNSYGSITQGQTESITITASAEDLEIDEYFCDLRITSNDPEMNLINIPISMLISSEFPIVSVSEEIIEFGTIAPAAVVSDTLSISNLGSETLNISNIEINIPEYTISPASLSIDPGNTEEFIITFSPLEEDEYFADMTIFSNDPVNPELVVLLMGEAILPVGIDDLIPLKTKVHQNYPNPFNPNTMINYSIAEAASVKIVVYNIKGEKVKILVDEYQDPKNYQIVWNGTDVNEKKVASGVYFYKFLAGKYLELKKMLLIK
jgi:Peptidase family C25/Propeptide_C25/HYDIN/CFA65/VesB-like, Ig-like domain